MNDNTKLFLKQAGTLILCGLIGGIIGGLIVKCCIWHCGCCCNHFHVKHSHCHHGHHFMGKFEEGKPVFEKNFVEENYIIVPKDLVNFIKQNEKAPKPFSGPRP